MTHDATKLVAVYRLRDKANRLLYIGVSSNPDDRFHNWAWGHALGASWWPKVVEPAEVTWYPDRAAALAAEKEAIQTEHPYHNTQWRTEPPEDWEWADYEPPVNQELVDMMRNRRWGGVGA